jgi:ubiquinone/menaquinone biosynthesis C-methylase UbiE
MTQASEDTRPGWDKIAPGYDKTNTKTQMWLGKEGLTRAGLRSGQSFLDVASGSGALSIPAARMGAKVTAVDHSPVMLELLQKRAKAEGLNVETRAMDAYELKLADNTFDVVGSQFGVVVLEDMPRGLREMVRVTKPGGKVLMNVYGDPHKIEFFGYFVQALQAVRPDFDGPPMDPLPPPFQLHDPERLRRELVEAGCTDVKVEQLSEPTEYPTGADLWEWIMWSNPIAEHVLEALELTADERVTVKKRMDELHKEGAGAKGTLTLTAPINIGVGTKK